MGLLDMLGLESAKARKRKQQRFYKKVYPLGKAQQDWERCQLTELFPRQKDVRHFQFELLVLREKMADLEDPEVYDEDEEKPSLEEVIERWRKGGNIYKLSPQDKEKLIALALKERDLKLEELQ